MTQLSVRREAGRRLVGTLFFRVLILALILYTVYHCAIAAAPRMTTAVVSVGEESVVTEGRATIFRDETVLTADGQGMLISYPLENGAKVSANSTLVTLYTTTLDAETLSTVQAQLSALDERMVSAARAERQYTYATTATGSASLSRVHEDIRAHILQIAATESRNTDTLAELMLSLHAYAQLTEADGGGGASLTPTEALTAQRSALLATVARSARSMTMRELVRANGEEEGLPTFSGYFYHAEAVDGYETVFSRQALATMNIVDYDAMHRAVPTEYTGRTLLGKTVGSYHWSLTLPVDFAVADTLTAGQTYTVRFPSEGDVALAMTLDRVIRSVGDGRAVLVLSADEMPPTFRFTRHQTVQLVLETVRGYRIPETALQRVDGRECVYILQDGSVRLREVRVLLRGEGYVIVDYPGEEENGLSLHDVVITSGKDLYDGKYID